MKSILYNSLYPLIAVFVILLSGCRDDLLYYDGEIPEGEGTLSATVTFTPMWYANLEETRTPGNLLNDIRCLSVFVYTSDGNLFRAYSSDSRDPKSKFTYTPGEYTVNQDKDHLDGNEAHTDETSTAKATFTLDNIPFGIYRIYAVANIDNILDNYSEEIQTIDGLKNISLDWKPGSVNENDQMFGYFTPADNMVADGFEAPEPITFVKPMTSIHSWLKRAASKVTVAFNPSGLYQGVTVYIRNVTIRDIPTTCPLGAENRVASENTLFNHLTPPYPKPSLNAESSAVDNSRFEYNSEGLITNQNEHTGSAKTDGYALTNHIREAVPAGAHAANAQSLFFYENNQQPDYDIMTPDQKKRYDKNQQSEGEDAVGKPIRDNVEKDQDGNVIKTDLDLKDRVPLGTYIEVEAYYISSNPKNVGEGAIKYRFMLGKDTHFDYNAQRNYHYKLTLGFNGWANNPDWHIDYELPNPGIEVPPVFRVSYLYHQMSELPIRILGNCTDLVVTITENNWAPYDPNGTDEVPPARVTTTDNTCDKTGAYIFEWNREAYFNNAYRENGKEVPYFGFLALHMPDKTNTTTIDQDYGSAANTALKNYYINNKIGERHFNGVDLGIGTHTNTQYDESWTADDKYTVDKIYNDLGQEIPNEKTLMLPLWTRALSLIRDSGFSGNNPYEGYERKAMVHIHAKFSDGTEVNKDVTVLQVKRIVNPKGVWRASNKTQAFHVTLLEAINANGLSNFKPFTSEGEWMAYIESDNKGTFSLDLDNTDGYKDANGYIHGYTGSTIDFKINFGAAVGADQSECAIVKVLYHGNQCLHKILVRKGYEAPIEMGGKVWSSYSLYQATPTGGQDGVSDTYDAVLTKNPLMLGSMFRRGKQSRGIFVSNNMKADLGPFKAPGSIPFVVGRKNSANTGWMQQTWTEIGYRDDVFTQNYVNSYSWYNRPGRSQGSQSYGLGTFFVGDQKYKVPSYEDFDALTKACEFGFGVIYGSAATEPKRIADEAYGLIDPDNEGLFDDPNGMRGVIAYDKDTGNQIFFPMGRYGTGRRNNYVLTGNDAGELRYGDVQTVLEIGSGNNNLYRPIPYNLKISSGNIYWIDMYKPDVREQYTNMAQRGCLGWDMNYFNFDFNPYTANNWCDACPIKFILIDD